MTIEVQKSDWAIVALSILAGIIAAAHIGKATASLPLLRSELGLTIIQAGWVVSIIAAMGMASGMIAGMVADRVGHRRQMIIGLLTIAISSAIGSMATGSGLLLASRFMEGVGFIAIVVSAPPLIITSILSRHRSVVLGVWSVWLPSGMALSMLISSPILGSYGWRSLWLFWTILSLILVALLLTKTDKGQGHVASPEQHHSFVGSLRLILSRPGPMLMALNFAVFAAQWGSMVVWIPSFLVEQRSTEVSTAALLGALVVVFNVPGNLMGSWLLHRGVARCHLISGTHLMMGLCAVGVFSDTLPDGARYGLVLLFSHAAGYLAAAMFASVPVHAPSPQQFGATNGLLIQGANFGNFFGPPAAAAIVAALGNWNGVLWLILACAGTGFVLSLWLTLIEKKRLTGESVG
jgi:MFS family permease